MDPATVDAVHPTRYRCAACGNLTRFDVTATRTTRAFHHYTLGGDLAVEHEVVLAETVQEVACRWCGHGRSVEVLDGDAAGSDGDAAGPAGQAASSDGEPVSARPVPGRPASVG